MVPISRWFNEVAQICKQIFCHSLHSWGGVKCDDYRMSTILAATLLMSLVLGGGFGAGITYIPPLIDWTGSKISNPVSADQTGSPAFSGVGRTTIQSPTTAPSKDAKNCDLSKGGWKLWLGNLNAGIDDRTRFSLPLNSSQALFKYQGNVQDVSTCEFTFVPRGEKAINYVVSFDGIYQVVLGDNDYWTISLRASDSIDGPLYPIKEDRVEKTRPSLSAAVKTGSIVKTRIDQLFLEDGRYNVKLSIQYTPSSLQDNNGQNSESFSWTFTPSPAIELQPVDISIGLIRAKGDTSEVGVSFVSPNPKPEE